MSARPTRLANVPLGQKLASIAARVGAWRPSRFPVVRATACATRLQDRASVPSGNFGIDVVNKTAESRRKADVAGRVLGMCKRGERRFRIHCRDQSIEA
jgi:hypothetical protein